MIPSPAPLFIFSSAIIFVVFILVIITNKNKLIQKKIMGVDYFVTYYFVL